MKIITRHIAVLSVFLLSCGAPHKPDEERARENKTESPTKEPIALKTEIANWAQSYQYSPVSVSGCDAPIVEELQGSSAKRTFSVQCSKGVFELELGCSGKSFSTCSQNIKSFQLTDSFAEAKRQLVEERLASKSMDGPRCNGAMAIPEDDAATQFTINCSNGFKTVPLRKPSIEETLTGSSCGSDAQDATLATGEAQTRIFGSNKFCRA